MKRVLHTCTFEKSPIQECGDSLGPKNIPYIYMYIYDCIYVDMYTYIVAFPEV